MMGEYLIEWFHEETYERGDTLITAKSLLEAEEKFYEEFKDGYMIVYIGRLYI